MRKFPSLPGRECKMETAMAELVASKAEVISAERKAKIRNCQLETAMAELVALKAEVISSGRKAKIRNCGRELLFSGHAQIVIRPAILTP